ncbi:hypothetical protein MKW94_007564 [Papaver nudicaule]|uniref:Neprosin PEP catalytic domain-containing protein n=1 Tax=Papaver nudicaule TaxID=74823 RepID=A0AA42AZM9_PAPNU|nr:hypothetical protein [Papaver nudicaule]
MAPFSDLKVTGFLLLVVGLVLTYHVTILVEGGRNIASKLSEEEGLELERQLNILNKPSIKTVHTRRGVIYDCVEFHKQPAFDHPLLKTYAYQKIDETTTTQPHKRLISHVEGCPKGTVPIRRTTKEDLIRAKYLSSSSNALGDEYRAGYTLTLTDERFYGASGIVNVWNPKVNPDQFSGVEVTLKAGTTEEANEIRFGWTVYPQLYGENATLTYAYWTGDGGHKTGCYNTLCLGFVQVDGHYTPDMYLDNISVVGGTQFEHTSEVFQEHETGKWWLTIQGVKVGFWPEELFPLFDQGAEQIFWGGRVKSGKDGTPNMASGALPDDYTDHTGYYAELLYRNRTHDNLKPSLEIQNTVDCRGPYNSNWDNDHTILHFGGPGGGTCA